MNVGQRVMLDDALYVVQRIRSDGQYVVRPYDAAGPQRNPRRELRHERGELRLERTGLALVTTTNLQAAAPTKLFNRVMPASSLLTKTSSATATVTLSLA